MKKIAFLFAALVLFVTGTVFAQPELDVSFGSGGKTSVVFGALAATKDMAIQADNKIVLVSPCFSINLQGVPFCAVRLNENGTFDNSFQSLSGFAGVYTWFDNSRSGQVDGVAIQNDGKILAVGTGPGTSDQKVAVVRYNSDGSLDNSFGTGGIVLTDVTPASTDRAKKIVIQPDGKILLVGNTGNAQFVARYLTNGSLDTSFGMGGFARTVIPGNTSTGISIALQSDGRILAGGGAGGSHLISRFNSDGSPDTTWDGDGVLTIGSGGSGDDEGFRSLAVQANGRVVALGHNNILYRFNPDGTIDPSFDGDGSRPALSSAGADPHDIIITPGGRITVVGEQRVPPGPGFVPSLYLTARYLSSGSPDPAYSDDGFLDIDLGQGTDGAWAVAVDGLGRIAIGGRSSNCCVQNPWEQPVFSAVRLNAPVVTIGIAGRVLRSDGRTVPNAILNLDDGTGSIRVARSNPFGYYRFRNLQPGHAYSITVRSKSFNFPDRNVVLTDDLTDLDFISSNSKHSN